MFTLKVCVKVSILAVLLSLSNCEPPVQTSYGVPFNNGYGNQQNYHNHHEGQDPEHSEPKSYEFGYAVKDEYSGNDYKRRESSDGNQVHGEYRVQLPDGRTQIVTYYADWQTGFHADVRYEGTASYPDQYGHQQQQPNYQYGAPAPTAGFGNQYGAPATSSVNIKDFSAAGAPYSTGTSFNNGYGNNYDSYATAGNFGGRSRPSSAYGAP